MTPRWLTLPLVLISARFGVAESACAYVTVEALSGSSLDTGHGTLDLAAYERGEDSPTLYVDFDTHVNFTAGTGWRSYTAWEDGVLTNGICGTACGEDERVSSGTCVACLGGSTNAAGDDIKGGGDTYCACAENERVEANACEACESGKTRPAGDPVPGGDTSCAAFACGENERVASNACVACVGGSTNAAGDDAAGEADTYCACAENERVVSNACVACAAGTANGAGDPVPGDDTECGVIACDASGAIANGAAGPCDDALAAGTSCEPSCAEGYAVTGARSCSLEGALNDTAVCGLATCDASGAIANGEPAGCGRDLKAGSSCAPVCDAGFELTGSRTCDASGTLSDTAACAATSKDASEVAADALAAAESTRDAILSGVSAADQRKAKLLANLAIAGVKAKEIAMAIVADDADAACADALAKGQIRPDSDAAACDAELSGGGGGGASGRRLRAASYDVTLTVNPEEVDDIALVETLAAEGVAATSAEVDPIEALGAIAGVDSSLVASFEAEAAAAAEAAEAAEAAAASPPSPPASPPPPPGAPLVLVEDDVSGARRRPRGIGIVAAAFLAATTLGGSRSRERWRVRARA